MDQNKFVNCYIETMMNTLNETTAQLIQLKTQLKITTDTLTEKDNVINDLSNKLSQNQFAEKNYHENIQKIQNLENELHVQRNKTSHMDTLIGQLNQMKVEIQEKNLIIEQNKIKIEEYEKAKLCSCDTIELKKPKIKEKKKTSIESDKETIVETVIVNTENDF